MPKRGTNGESHAAHIYIKDHIPDVVGELLGWLHLVVNTGIVHQNIEPTEI